MDKAEKDLIQSILAEINEPKSRLINILLKLKHIGAFNTARKLEQLIIRVEQLQNSTPKEVL